VIGYRRRFAIEESHVSSVLIAISVAVLTFGSGILGLYFQKRLPIEHMSGGSRDMILGVIGLVTLLLALVLGTLVGNTYAFFANQKSELETYASRAVLLDRALARYGPEAKPVRDQLKAALTESYELFWKAAEIDPKQLGVEVAVKRYEPIGDSIAALNPLTAAQKEALSAANLNLGLMEQTRILMSLQLASPISWSLVFIVVAWSMFLFCGFGVLSGSNPTTIAVLGLGAISVASAIFLILDLSQPHSGLFRVSPAALEQTIEAVDK
jgi:hypothetical protein